MYAIGKSYHIELQRLMIELLFFQLKFLKQNEITTNPCAPQARRALSKALTPSSVDNTFAAQLRMCISRESNNYKL